MNNNSLDKARKIINGIDAEMAELFAKRMEAVKIIAEYKAENNIPVLDLARENEVIEKNSLLCESDEIKEYYLRFLKSNMAISRSYQENIIASVGNANFLRVALGNGYDISVGRGILCLADKYFNLGRRVFIITDDDLNTL